MNTSEYRGKSPIGNDGAIGIAEGEGAGNVFAGIEGSNGNAAGNGRMILGAIVIGGVVGLVVVIEVIGGELQGIAFDEHNNGLLIGSIAPDDVPAAGLCCATGSGNEVVGIYLGAHGAEGIVIFFATGKRNDCQ